MKSKSAPWVVTVIFLAIIIILFLLINKFIPDRSKIGASNTPEPTQATTKTPLNLSDVIATLFWGDFIPASPSATMGSFDITPPLPATQTPFERTIATPKNTALPTRTKISTSISSTITINPPISSATMIPPSSTPPIPTFFSPPPTHTSIFSSPTFDSSTPVLSTPTNPLLTPTLIVVPHRKACNDNIDNDQDGFIDMQDPQCKNPGDNDESR